MNNPRILIVRPDRMGDVILSTPLPREIKKQFPNAYVAVLVRKYTKDIFMNNPHVDEILIYDEAPTLASKIAFARNLRQYQFSHSFSLLPTEPLNWTLFFAGIGHRFGVGHKFYQFISNTKSVYRRKLKPLRHEADYCFDFARKIGIELTDLSTEIHLSEEENKVAARIKAEIAPKGEKIIAIHTSFGASTPNMPEEEYCRLVNALSFYESAKIVNTDLNPPDCLRQIPEIHFVGKSMRELFITLSICDLVVSSSTGPSHAAAALKVPTLTVFCPLPACSPELWSPMGNKAVSIIPEKEYCAEKCPGDPKLCSFQGEGGIDHKKMMEQIQNFLNLEETE